MNITPELPAEHYMKQFIYILLLTVTGIFAGCTDIDKENPYDNQLHSLQAVSYTHLDVYKRQK